MTDQDQKTDDNTAFPPALLTEHHQEYSVMSVDPYDNGGREEYLLLGPDDDHKRFSCANDAYEALRISNLAYVDGYNDAVKKMRETLREGWAE